MSTHTVATSKSWFERIGNSFGGILFGIILFIAGTMLLWWNEGNFVKTQTALNEAQAVVTELGDISMVNTASSGQLVHATGTAMTDDVLEDPYFGISTNAIRLERAVEYYQWVEDSKSETKQKLGGGEETITTYSYRKDWVTSPVNSSQFKAPNAAMENKNNVIVDVEKFSVQAINVTFGAYRLPKFLVDSIGGSESLSVELSDEVVAKLIQQIASHGLPLVTVDRTRPPSQGILQFEEEEGEDKQTVAPAAPPKIVHGSGNTIYLGQNPTLPAIGDVRATFKRTPPSNTVSLIAKLNGNTFESFVASNGKPVGMLSMGTHSAENMFASAHASNSMVTWILRIVGVFLVCISLTMMFAPLQVFASVVPFLGKLVGVGAGLFSMLFGAAWSLMIIALAWLFYRPLIGILLLAMAVGLIVLIYNKRRSNKIQQ